MRAVLNIAVLGLVAGLLAGCGGDGQNATGTSATTTTASATQEPTKKSTEKAEAKGLAGTWKPINESPIGTLTIIGTTAETTGQLACPGDIINADAAEPVLTLNCTTPNDDRKRGTLELKPDGSALVITWDGPSWGGAIDSLKRAD
jgi:hypothetical protein